MGESHLISQSDGLKEDSVLDMLNSTALNSKSSETYKQQRFASKQSTTRAQVPTKQLTQKMDKAIQRAFEDSDALGPIDNSALSETTVCWQRIVENEHPSCDKRLYPPNDSGSNTPVSEKACGIGKEIRMESPTALEKPMNIPDFEWNSIELHPSQSHQYHYKTEEKDIEVAAEETQMDPRVETLDICTAKPHQLVWRPPVDWGEDGGSQQVNSPVPSKSGVGASAGSTNTPSVSISKPSKGKVKSGPTKNGKKCGSDPKEGTANPFSHRPSEPVPFSTRPSSEQAVSLVTGINDVNDADSVKQTKLETNGREGDEFDEMSTQSIDRHLVRENSHRRLLRKQVADRRESLQSILSATKRNMPPEKDDLLSLKRKLATSQALVQQLEVEKSEVTRQAVLDVARAQAVLLEQRNNREMELENQIKRLMKERNAAIEECHQLRILLSQACAVCKRRFDERGSYFMDHYVRHTAVSKEPRPNSTAFEWFTGNLNIEALELEAKPFQRRTKVHDLESVSIGETTKPESDTPSISNTAPFSWLSEKVFMQKLNSTETMPITTIQISPEDNSIHEGDETQTATETNTSKSEPNNSITTSQVLQEKVNTSKMEGLTAIDNEQTESTPKRKGFFASLLGEKVVDEFSSLGLPQAATRASGNSSNKFSLFGSLRGEEVKDDFLGLGLGQSLSIISEEKQAPLPCDKRNFGLNSEQVLDDMALIDSLASIGNASRSLNSNKMGRLGFQDEKAPEEVSDSTTVPYLPKCKLEKEGLDKRRSLLSQESFDVDRYDERLVGRHDHVSDNFLSSPSEGDSKGRHRITEAADQDRFNEFLLSPRRKFEEKASSSPQTLHSQPSLGTGISSPFTWKRNRGSIRGKESELPKYLGKYRSKSPSLNEVESTDRYCKENGVYLTETSPTSSPTKIVSHQTTDDSHDRPWRSKAQLNPTTSQFIDSSISNELQMPLENKGSTVDEFDHVATLLEKENASWE
ncbi:hypothetical protein IV203_002765 [Nitzschia inconspicua]|uniref:Uncharacterized protein n=1 Tax=Nitzschia inconspicua TaxID=303405 RepID=A0A9K3PMZ1_9STRA|nr:hypothetical protein IV203_002765 [Nitzschia inconspicua]